MGRLFFNGVFAIQMVWLAWGISWFAASGWSAGVARLAPEQWRYRIFTFSSFPLLLVFSPVFQRPPFLLYNAPRLLQWAMFACVCGIVAFSWWSRLTLGRLWSASIQRKDAHRVVEEGPYALVRHPIYTALIGAALATATAKGTVIAWAGAACFVIGYWLKARQEEKFLRGELGEAGYDDYAARVPMLVPFIRF